MTAESKRTSKRQVWHPAAYDKQDVRSIQALALYAMEAERPRPDGQPAPEFTPYDAKRVLDWIINEAAQTYDNGTAGAFGANDPHGRIAAFVDGRRSVGQQLIKLMRLKIVALEPGAPRNEDGIGPEHEPNKEP